MRRVEKMSMNISNEVETSGFRYGFNRVGGSMFQLLKELDGMTYSCHIRGVG